MQLGDLLDLARAFPQTTMVLNHIGGPVAIGPYAGKRDEAFKEWRSLIQQIGALPNTYVKLGGLGMRMLGFDFFNTPEPPSSEDLAEAWKPYIETCIAAFGPQRAMFESNFPVDKGTCSYPVLWNAFARGRWLFGRRQDVAFQRRRQKGVTAPGLVGSVHRAQTKGSGSPSTRRPEPLPCAPSWTFRTRDQRMKGGPERDAAVAPALP